MALDLDALTPLREAIDTLYDKKMKEHLLTTWGASMENIRKGLDGLNAEQSAIEHIKKFISYVRSVKNTEGFQQDPENGLPFLFDDKTRTKMGGLRSESRNLIDSEERTKGQKIKSLMKELPQPLNKKIREIWDEGKYTYLHLGNYLLTAQKCNDMCQPQESPVYNARPHTYLTGYIQELTVSSPLGMNGYQRSYLVTRKSTQSNPFPENPFCPCQILLRGPWSSHPHTPDTRFFII